MWLFWIVAGALAAAAAALVVTRAVRAAGAAATDSEDPALAVYRRQLSEIDDLAARALLGEAERRAAHAEAGRRLLAAAEMSAPKESAGGRGPRLAVLIGVGLALVAALALYLVLGSPGLPDQPFKARMAAWRAKPDALQPAEMAAVLKVMAKERPGDPQAQEYLGRAEMISGDPAAAAEAIARAAASQPQRADLQILLGEALAAAADGKASPAAEAAFRRALAIDPSSVSARYFLARTQILTGDRAVGEAAWKALHDEIAVDDPRRPAMEQDMAQVLGGPAAGQGDQAAFIQGMVARLAARLKATPDDPDGWARLVRAYKVLGDKPKQAEALDQARKVLAGRPQDLAKVEAEAH